MKHQNAIYRFTCPDKDVKEEEENMCIEALNKSFTNQADQCDAKSPTRKSNLVGDK
jgi:hypothetical protein